MSGPTTSRVGTKVAEPDPMLQTSAGGSASIFAAGQSQRMSKVDDPIKSRTKQIAQASSNGEICRQMKSRHT
jgi:hypothetical protein